MFVFLRRILRGDAHCVPRLARALSFPQGVVPSFSRELEEAIVARFARVVAAYGRMPRPRSSFWPYGYVLTKILAELDEPLFVEHVPVVRSAEKRARMDALWEALRAVMPTACV